MTMRKIKILAVACAALTAFTSSSHALTCEVDPANFEFTSDSPSTFNIGMKEDVDKAYDALSDSIESLESYQKTQIFYSKGYDRITEYECSEDKCRSSEILQGLQKCNAGGMSKADACYPLAVVYHKKLYCLLFPGQTNFDPSKPFIPYIPFKTNQGVQ